MDCQRSGNGYAPNALGFREIGEWTRLRKIVLEQWQLDAIVAMDVRRRSMFIERDEPEVEISERPLSPDLFDALFGGGG
ncbi:hypothetical protein ABIA22_002249 [Sinorhizobium fredii]